MGGPGGPGGPIDSRDGIVKRVVVGIALNIDVG